MDDISTEALIKRLKRKGRYTIKQSGQNWFVDGAYGYCVASLFGSKREAVIAALDAIAYAKDQRSKPAWFHF